MTPKLLALAKVCSDLGNIRNVSWHLSRRGSELKKGDRFWTKMVLTKKSRRNYNVHHGTMYSIYSEEYQESVNVVSSAESTLVNQQQEGKLDLKAVVSPSFEASSFEVCLSALKYDYLCSR